MEILQGAVEWNKTQTPCTYGKTEDGRQYYFKKELINGNIIVTTALIEFVDEMTKAKNIGLIDRDGNEIIPCVNTAITAISDDVLLVEPAEPISQNVIEANSLRMDPLSATRLVSTPAQIKEKINVKMSQDGRYKINDQFKEATICDANGNNLVNGEYYSFIALDGDKLYMAKNYPETDVTEFSITDRKIVEAVEENVVEQPTEAPVQENVVEQSTEVPVEENVVEQSTEAPVQENVVEQPTEAPVEDYSFSQPEVGNINEGFAKEDIDLGQTIDIPSVDNTYSYDNQFEVTPTTNDNFEEVTEGSPVAEINDNEVVVEDETAEIPDTGIDDGESEIERRIKELNEKYSNMNALIDEIVPTEEKEEPVEEIDEAEEVDDAEEVSETKEMEEETNEKSVFSSLEVNKIDSIDDEDDLEDTDDKYSYEDETYEDVKGIDEDNRRVDDIVEKASRMKEENIGLREENARLNEENNELSDKLKSVRRNSKEKIQALEFKVSAMDTKNQSLKSTVDKLNDKIDSLEAKIHDQNKVMDLTKRENEKLRLENKKLNLQVEKEVESRNNILEKLGEAFIDEENDFVNKKVA